MNIRPFFVAVMQDFDKSQKDLRIRGTTPIIKEKTPFSCCDRLKISHQHQRKSVS